jgi:RpiB/LacA/LacB family sugar-phosphate isomerase
MNVYIGADHRGFDFKNKIIKILEGMGHTVHDMGSYDPDKSFDYPKAAHKVATNVAKKRNARGLLVCMSGHGQAMAANKVKGAYAALCHNVESAKLSREHNNANILVLGAKFVQQKDLKKIIQTFFTTKFEGGRHQRRVNQIKKIERHQKL